MASPADNNNNNNNEAEVAIEIGGMALTLSDMNNCSEALMNSIEVKSVKELKEGLERFLKRFICENWDSFQKNNLTKVHSRPSSTKLFLFYYCWSLKLIL